MERFWNIIYYFINIGEYKFLYYLYKFTGMFWLYNRPSTKKQFGHTDAKAYLMKGEWLDGWGAERFISFWFLPFFIIFLDIWMELFDRPKTPIPFLIAILISAVIIGLFNETLLFRKDKYKKYKYQKYFKEFEKMPYKWKIKWALISSAVILFPFVLLIAYVARKNLLRSG